MPQATASSSSSSRRTLAWRPTKIMNMRDLSRDDDFLSHLLVEKLGTGAVPLVVHKMDGSRIIPRVKSEDLLRIVRRLVAAKAPSQSAIRDAVDELLTLFPVRSYLDGYDQKQINAFATHASRYFELYLPSGSIEIAHTSRYSQQTGKSELCILATRPLMPGMVITELKGSMADLTEEEDMELKRIDGTCVDGAQIRRDFSVIHSKQLKKNHLFLGPARFVNHDCDHNVELFREGRYITFRVIKPIGVGEEVTAHYGDGYFGRKNKHCLCETCEKLGRGGYASQVSDDELSDSGPGSPEPSQGLSRREAAQASGDEDESGWEDEDEVEVENVNQRSTRRGVYAVVKEKGNEKEKGKSKGKGKAKESEKGNEPKAGGGQIELGAEVEPDTASELTSLTPSRASVPLPGPSKGNGLMTPDPEAPLAEWLRGVGAESPLSASVASTPGKPRAGTSVSVASTPTTFRSVISTRSQKAKEQEAKEASALSDAAGRGSGRGRGRGGRGGKSRGQSRVESVRQLATPPTTDDSSASAATSVRSSSRIRTRSGEKEVSSGSSRLTTPREDKTETASASGEDSEELSKGKEKQREEPAAEARTLRPRAVYHGIGLGDQQSVSAKVPIAEPRDAEGRLLPTCATCKNVLPIIHVGDEVIWGHAIGRTGKRGRPRKNVHAECPRCLRHYEIYALKWPERLPGDGSSAFLPTPREMRNSTPITHSALAALDRKLAFAVHGYAPPKRPYNKRQREAEDDASNVRPAKKAKTSTGRPRGRPPKVKMSSKAEELVKAKPSKVSSKSLAPDNGRKSSRTRVPTLKLRESEPPKSRVSSTSRTRVSRSRPPVSSASTLSGADIEDAALEAPHTPVKAKSEEIDSPKVPTPKSLAVAAQPRESNGRFGKKSQTNGRFVRKGTIAGAARRSRAHRTLGSRTKNRSRLDKKTRQSDIEPVASPKAPSVPLLESGAWEDDPEESSHETPIPPLELKPRETLSLKRSHSEVQEEEEEEEDEFSTKRTRVTGMTRYEEEEEEDGSEQEHPSFRPSLWTRGSKLGPRLFGAPNPMTFARRKWAPSMGQSSRASSTDGPQSSTDDDANLPVTPEDDDVDPPDAEELVQQLALAQDEGDRGSIMSVPYPRPLHFASAFMGKLTLKPSPVNLARRRWAPPPPKFHEAVAAEQQSANHADAQGSGLEYGDDDRYSSCESSDEESDLPDLAGSILERAKALKQPLARRTSLESDSADDSKIVEQLVNLSPSGPSDSSDVSRPTSSGSDLSPDKSPGMAWKRTVLFPTPNIPYLNNPAASFAANFPSSPVRLMRAGWDTASDTDS